MTTDELLILFQTVEDAFSTSSANKEKESLKELLLGNLEKLRVRSSQLGFDSVSSLAKAVSDLVDGSDWESPSAQEMRQMLQFAFATLREGIAASGGMVKDENIQEFYGILGIVPGDGDVEDERRPLSSEHDHLKVIDSILDSSALEDLDLSNLRLLVEKIGGDQIILDEEKKSIAIVFPAFPEKVKYLERVFSLYDLDDEMTKKDVSSIGSEFADLILKLKEFMVAFSQNDIKRARDVLDDISRGHDGRNDLYGEIGKIARKLHESLKVIAKSLDPQLREFVEEKIPDSGDRLEHILKLTEKAANTTLDNIDELQERKELEEKVIKEFKDLIGSLLPLSEQARLKLQEAVDLGDKIEEYLSKDHKNLVAIMTAQDFQDLTGQIIIKIINLLKDLESKLVNLIKGFGVSVKEAKEVGKGVSQELLYGPAHEKKDALRSQDDVDSLLAEFGF